MSKIAIIGAGRVGKACAKILNHLGGFDVVLIDNDVGALSLQPGCETRVATQEQLEEVIVDIAPIAVICSTPFFVNVQVAEIAARLGLHYVDFTEDNRVTRAIEALEITRSTFVPQTGLAPGLISYIGLSLFEALGTPSSLSLRVGALPHVSFGPAHYAITWSPEGLINEYLNPAVRKVDGIIEEAASLSEEESIVLDGVRYEAFNTSGGVGSLAAYDHIPSVDYKTIRYPGHLQFMQKFIASAGGDLEKGVAAAKRAFVTTRNDLVVLIAVAVDTANHSASRGIHFYPHDELDLTALELTTSGTGVAVLELILRGELPTGVLHQNQISFDLLRTTKAYRLIFSAAR